MHAHDAWCPPATGLIPPTTCGAFLGGSEKGRLQWALERDLRAFDREAAGLNLPPS